MCVDDGNKALIAEQSPNEQSHLMKKGPGPGALGPTAFAPGPLGPRPLGPNLEEADRH